jgi:hypothetical protein
VKRGLRDLDERDDHRHSKPRRQVQGLVRHGERQQGTHPSNPLWGDGWGWSWFDTDKPLKTTSTDCHTVRISRPASLGGRMLRRSSVVAALRRPMSCPAILCGKP